MVDSGYCAVIAPTIDAASVGSMILSDSLIDPENYSLYVNGNSYLKDVSIYGLLKISDTSNLRLYSFMCFMLKNRPLVNTHP